MSETWVNDDGLVVKFGTTEAKDRVIGAINNEGEYQVLTLELDTDDTDNFPVDADGSVILNDNLQIPEGVLIESVEVVTYEDFDSAGDAFVFDIGVIDTDRSSNADPDALIDAATQSEMNTGGTNVAGWVGSAVGAVTTKNLLLTWETTGADATAGHAVVRIKWTPQPPQGDTLIWSK